MVSTAPIADVADSVWLVCESGDRSCQAAMPLDRHGIRATSVDGGTSAWRSVGLPLTPGA